MARPWMPMWWGDYLADTRNLSLEEHGAYLLLIGHYWQHGPLPDDPKRLRRIVGATARQWERVWPAVSSFFDLIHNPSGSRDVSATEFVHTEQANAKQLLSKHWRHKRIDAELEKAEILSTKRQLAGQRGGLKSSGLSNVARHAKQAIAEQTGHHPHPHPHLTSPPPPPELSAARTRQKISSSQFLDENVRKKGWAIKAPDQPARPASDVEPAEHSAQGASAKPKKTLPDYLREKAAAAGKPGAGGNVH